MTPCASMAGRLDDLGHLCHVNCVLAFCSGAVAPGWVCRCSSDSERPRADNQNSSGDEEHRKAQRLDNKVPEPSGQGGSPRCRVGGCSTTKAPALVSTPLQRPTGEGAASAAPRGLRRLGPVGSSPGPVLATDPDSVGERRSCWAAQTAREGNPSAMPIEGNAKSEPKQNAPGNPAARLGGEKGVSMPNPRRRW